MLNDISICKNDTCDYKFKCHRYESNVISMREYQSYFISDKINDDCDYFIPIEQNKKG